MSIDCVSKIYGRIIIELMAFWGEEHNTENSYL